MIYLLNDRVFKGVKNLPVIEINFLKKELDLSRYQALIFSSKNGVLGVDKIDKGWRDIPAYSIGSGTSKVINDLNGKLVFSSKNSYGDEFAKEIKDLLYGKKTLFLRAKIVTSNLNKILHDSGVDLDEEIVYETLCSDCKKLQKPPKNSIIIFSSPSTIECFFKCFKWDNSYKAVVIGKNTASFMPREISYMISPKQNILSCIDVARELFKQ